MVTVPGTFPSPSCPIHSSALGMKALGSHHVRDVAIQLQAQVQAEGAVLFIAKAGFSGQHACVI